MENQKVKGLDGWMELLEDTGKDRKIERIYR